MSRIRHLRWIVSATTVVGLTLFAFQFIPRQQHVNADEIAVNLLKDGMMDEASKQDPKMPAHWKHSGPIDGVTYRWLSNSKEPNKETCLQIAKSANRYFPIASWSQTFDHNSDAPALVVSSKVRTSKVTKAIIDAIFLDANGEVMEHCWVAYIGPKEDGGKPFTHNWKEYKGVVAIPAGCKKITVSLQDYGPGSVMFDDVLATYETDTTKITDALSMKLPYTEEELTGGDSFNEVQIAENPVTSNPYSSGEPAPGGLQFAQSNTSVPYGGIPSSSVLAPPVRQPLATNSGQIYFTQPPAYPVNNYPITSPAPTSFNADGVREVHKQATRNKLVNGAWVIFTESQKVYETEDFARFNDEAAAKVHAETLKLTKQYHQEKDVAAKTKIREALIEAVNKEFAAMRENRLMEIADLQKRLEEVKATLAKRDEVKDKIIERRVEHLLGVDPLYQWDSDNFNVSPSSPANYIGPQSTYSTQ